MNIEITLQKENQLLGRKEIQASVNYKGATPKRDDILKLVASKAGSKEELVIVKEIQTTYGQQVAKVTAYAYSSIDALKKLEAYTEPEVKQEESSEPSGETSGASEADATGDAKKEEGNQEAKTEEKQDTKESTEATKKDSEASKGE